MESDLKLLCKIAISHYKDITGCSVSYDGTDGFDESCGLRYYTEQIKEKAYENCFYFDVVDKKKYLVAKLKYGI